MAIDASGFLDPIVDADEWTPRRPFFRVPKGEESLRKFEAAALEFGVELRREIERQTAGKSVFAMNLPGQVAPAAQALWAELIEARRDGLEFAVWPFDGALDDLVSTEPVVVAEIYPRAAYGTALADILPARPRALAKTRGDVRVDAVRALEAAEWLRREQVTIDGRDYGLADDGDFDALLTAAALFRLSLAGEPLFVSAPDSSAEGGILCA
jgi:hypothetical protein